MHTTDDDAMMIAAHGTIIKNVPIALVVPFASGGTYTGR